MSYTNKRAAGNGNRLLWLIAPLIVAGTSVAAWQLGAAHGRAEDAESSEEQQLPPAANPSHSIRPASAGRTSEEHPANFANYPATVYEGALAGPGGDHSWPNMDEDLSQGINFGGHFTYVVMPCGTGCAGFWFVDRKTGEAIPAPEGDDNEEAVSMETRPNSNLVKVVWATSDFDGSGELRAPCSKQSFRWMGDGFRSLGRQTRVGCPAEIDQ